MTAGWEGVGQWGPPGSEWRRGRKGACGRQLRDTIPWAVGVAAHNYTAPGSVA